MASLTGQSVASSYEQLLHVDRDGGGNATTLVDLKDGDNGTTFALQLATDKINVNGDVSLNSAITLGVSGSTNGKINTPESMYFNIDSNTGQDDTEFVWGCDRAADSGGTELMRLTESGNLGIGTGSTVITNLEVKGTNSALDGVSAGLVVHDSGSANAGLQLINNSGKFAMHADGANDRVDFYLDNATTGSSFAGADKMLTLNYGGTVELSNGQLQFPATQNASSDANTLDDYEEGTWTVTDGSGAGLSFTLENNAYVKIGKLVTASAIVTFPSTSNASSALLTLPFNASSISSASGGTVLEQNINSAKAYVMAVDVANGVKIREFGSTTQTNANLSGKKIRFIITYHAS